MNKKVISIIAIVALVAVLGICLVACNADSYAKKLEKADYKVSVASEEDMEELEEEFGDVEIAWAVSGVKATDYVSVVKFKKSDDAKQFVEDMTASVLGVSLFEEDKTIVRSGSIVIFGSEQGVKDAK